MSAFPQRVVADAGRRGDRAGAVIAGGEILCSGRSVRTTTISGWWEHHRQHLLFQLFTALGLLMVASKLEQRSAGAARDGVGGLRFAGAGVTWPRGSLRINSMSVLRAALRDRRGHEYGDEPVHDGLRSVVARWKWWRNVPGEILSLDVQAVEAGCAPCILPFSGFTSCC